MQCPYCGTQLVEGANFCHACGKSLAEEAVAEEAVAKEAVAKEAVAEGAAQAAPHKGRGRFPWKVVGFGVGGLLLAGALGFLLFWLLRPTPQKVLAKAAATYKSASTLRTKSETSIAVMMFQVTITQQAVYKRPNLVRMSVTTQAPFMGEQSNFIVCDGKNLYHQMSLNKQVMKVSAPPTVSQVVAQSGGMEMLGGTALLDEVKLFEGETYQDKIKTAEFAPKENLDGHSCYVINLEFKDGGRQKVWIGTEDHLLWKNEMNLNMGFITLTMPEKFTEVTLNAPVTDADFVYKLPSGMKLVSSFSSPNFPGMPGT